ncbi:MAG TPA: biopolymer transporter ExbD [Acidobacteriaceae bacterium]
MLLNLVAWGAVMAFSASSSGSSSVQQSEINVTPLIDVLLVLLIIFMVIVPVTPRGLASAVPQDAPATERTLPPLTVRVTAGPDRQGAVYAVDGRVVQRVGLGRALEAALAARANRSVWVEANPGLSYRVVAEVVSEAKAAGATAIGLGRIG